MSEYFYEKVHCHPQIPAMIEILEYNDIQKIFVNQAFIPAHWHRSIEMTYIKNASVVLKVGQKESIITNDFTFVNSGDVHSITAQSFKEDSSAMIVIISYDFIKQYCPQIDDIVFDLSICEDHEELKEVFKQIKYLYLNQNQYSYLNITSCLLKLLNTLLNDYQLPKHDKIIHTQKKQERIKDVLTYIQDHYQEELTLSSMASLFCMSPEYFSRQFHYYIGKSFKDYLTSYRLYCAYNDLTSTDMTIQDIARKHGFFNVRSLIKIFKETYHDTPLQYRKKMSRN